MRQKTPQGQVVNQDNSRSDPPAGISDQAAALWDEVRSQLDGNDLLFNQPLLAQYLENYALWKGALRDVYEGDIKASGRMVEYQRNLTDILRRFGSDPYENDLSLEDDIELNTRQKDFIRHYCRLGNGTRAAVAAGYSEKGASVKGTELLAMDKVQRHIRVQRRSIARELNITQELVLQGMMSEAHGIGPDTNSAARMTAWREVAKLQGFFELDNKQRSAGLEAALAGLSSEQLDDLSAQLSVVA